MSVTTIALDDHIVSTCLEGKLIKSGFLTDLQGSAKFVGFCKVLGIDK